MFPVFTDDELDQQLIRLLQSHKGRESAIERWSLVTLIYGTGADHPRTDDNLQDRAIRKAVNRLRSHGWFILDMGDGHGRFLAESAQEYSDFRTSYLKPLTARADVIRAMDKCAAQEWPDLLQPALFDLSGLTVQR